MKDRTEAEQALLSQLEDSACRMNILCSMLELFEESDPFSFESEHLNPGARHAHRMRTIRFLGGLRDLAGFYYRDTNAAIETYYPGNPADNPLAT